MADPSDNAEGASSGGMQIVEENMDHAIMDQINQIKDDIAECVPLVGACHGVDELEKEFVSNDGIYIHKLADLKSRYSKIRKTRGDGNCFYRAFGFSCMEASVEDKQILTKLESVGNKTKDYLISIGYPAYTVEDFHETFTEMIGMSSKGATLDEILKIFNDRGYSDYFVVFMRLIVSSHLQSNADFFEAFIEGYQSIAEFCKTEVEPMAAESDHIHAIALTAATGITVSIEYMDQGGSHDKLNQHQFPDDGSVPSIFLLYRPGHYDVLYK